jgi:hypothetical protein
MMLYNNTVLRILEDFNIFPRAKPHLGQGPNIDFRGATPSGFLGGGLPGINATGSMVPMQLPKKKKKKKINKKVKR